MCDTAGMIERQIELTTPDGTMTTFVFHPEHGGPHPVVLYLMDAPSIRPALKDMASRLASAGYYVMMPFLFYRKMAYQELNIADMEGHQRQELMDSVTPTNIVGDAEAMLAHADADPAAADGKIGAIGFCMSGGLAVSVARAWPDRVGAAASIHGAWLVRDTPDSPHLGIDALGAELYFGWCDNDPTAPVEQLEKMRETLDTAGVTYDLDFFTDAEHGYAPPGTERYNRYASELHWERVHALLRRNLS